MSCCRWGCWTLCDATLPSLCFISKHPIRKTIQQEVDALKRKAKTQPLTPLRKWDANLQLDFPSLNRVQLPPICVGHTQGFICKAMGINLRHFSNELFRDQVVYSYALVDVANQVVHIVTHIHPNMDMSCQVNLAKSPNR